MIVKSGEDLRQELLAQQLVSQFKLIFEEARLPLHVRPFRVVVTGADSGLIEVVPDSVSIHGLKAATPGFTSLNQYFKTVRLSLPPFCLCLGELACKCDASDIIDDGRSFQPLPANRHMECTDTRC